MSKVINLNSLEWRRVRPDVAQEVYGKTLLDNGVKAVFTRVAPGGGFAIHKDTHGHLLYFLTGSGTVIIGSDQFQAEAGFAVRVTAGDDHCYRNTGIEDLTLISINIPG